MKYKKCTSVKNGIKKYIIEVTNAFSLLLKDGKMLIILFFISMFANPLYSICSTVLPSAFLGNLANNFSEHFSGATFLYVCWPAILYFFLDSVVFSFFFMFIQRAEKKCMENLALIGHRQSSNTLSRLDMKHFDSPKTYDIIQNGAVYDYNIAKSIVQRPFETVGNIITYIGYMVILLPLGWIAILVLTLSAVSTLVLSNKIEEFSDKIKRASTSERRRYTYLLELLLNKNNFQELRIYGLFGFLQEKLTHTHVLLTGYSLHEFRFRNSCSLISYIISGIPAWLCLAYVAVQTYMGKLTIEQFFLLSATIENFVAYTHMFVGVLSQMNVESLKLEHYREFCAIENDILNKKANDSFERLDNIEFRDVGLWYHIDESPVLKDISFSVPCGCLVSIVGPNGAGKSSLVKLISRLYDPNVGSIRVNDKDLRDFDAAQWYDKQSVLMQSYHLFSLSVNENICFSSFDIDKFNAAIRHSECEKLLKRLPQNSQTQCGKEFDEHGVDFSGGEGQRICLARAFYHDAEIWILDEPSAAIDPISEDAIFEYIYSQKGDKTIFVVSHRLSIAKKSDIILVLDDGRIVEQGNHSELMNRRGLYADLFNSQAQQYKIVEEKI